LREVQFKPISFEVFSDEIEEMKVQGEKIASWGSNVYVKIPITNTRGESTQPVVDYLSTNGVKVNVTALMTVDQVKMVSEVINPTVPSCVSLFAGRIADTGRNPIPIMVKSLEILGDFPFSELIWASPRELLNIFQADEIGCDIITATSDILNKLTLIGTDLESYSLDTVKMFRHDALESGFKF
jgi:transaldolase